MTKKLVAVVALMALALAGCSSSNMEESTTEEAPIEVNQPSGEVEVTTETYIFNLEEPSIDFGVDGHVVNQTILNP